jgi:hypothetical protein
VKLEYLPDGSLDCLLIRRSAIDQFNPHFILERDISVKQGKRLLATGGVYNFTGSNSLVVTVNATSLHFRL